MLEFSSEARQEQPDAGRPALSETADASRDSGDGSNRGGGGESGGSLDDLRMPAGGEQFREDAQREHGADAGSGQQGSDGGGDGGGSLDDLRMPAGGEQFREDAQLENRPDGDAGQKPPDGGGSLDDLRMPPGGEQIREDAQRENRPEAAADGNKPEGSDAAAARQQESDAESQAAAVRGLSDHPADDALKDQ